MIYILRHATRRGILKRSLVPKSHVINTKPVDDMPLKVYYTFKKNKKNKVADCILKFFLKTKYSVDNHTYVHMHIHGFHTLMNSHI